MTIMIDAERGPRFTKEQYEQAIKDLQDGLTQLEPNGHGCHICGDSGHQAWECGSNPLYAIAVCRAVADRATELHEAMHRLEEIGELTNANVALHKGMTAALLVTLHEFLHYLSGHDRYMGESYGPRKVRPL